jgi:hypothetical protein
VLGLRSEISCAVDQVAESGTVVRELGEIYSTPLFQDIRFHYNQLTYKLVVITSFIMEPTGVVFRRSVLSLVGALVFHSEALLFSMLEVVQYILPPSQNKRLNFISNFDVLVLAYTGHAQQRQTCTFSLLKTSVRANVLSLIGWSRHLG